MKSDDVERWRANWQDEVDGAALYRAMAEGESNPELAKLYENLARTEGEHADFWATKLDEAGKPVGLPAPSRRARTLSWLARRFGAQFVLPAVRGSEIGGGVEYHSTTRRGPVARGGRALTRASPRESGYVERRGRRDAGATRRQASGDQRERTASCRPRRERRVGLESQSGDGRRRGVAGGERDSHHRTRGPAGGRWLDGDGRVALRDEFARTVPAPDFGRGRRTRGSTRRGGSRTRADLSGEGAVAGTGGRTRRPNRRRPRDGARHARAGGTRHRPGRPRRVGVGSGGVVVRAVRARRNRSRRAVRPLFGTHGGGDQSARQRGRAVRHRSGNHAPDRTERPATPAGDRYSSASRRPS